MRRFTASLLATTILAGGAATGVALAAPSHHAPAKTEIRSVDRHGSADRQRSADRHGSRDMSREHTTLDRHDR